MKIVWKVTYSYFNNNKNWDNNPVLLNFNKRLLNQPFFYNKDRIPLFQYLSSIYFQEFKFNNKFKLITNDISYLKIKFCYNKPRKYRIYLEGVW
jgi:hypothetical protein